jgi:ABC-2 type transport system ATP-binding protein
MGELVQRGVRVADFSLAQPSLDEVFLALTGHPAEAAVPEQPTAREEQQA